MMLHILGVYISPHQKLEIALSTVYGIGPARAEKICEELGLGKNIRVNQLTNIQIYEISKHIEEHYLVGSDLRKDIRYFLQKLKSLKCYRGIRHTMKLPVRGQRTHTNAKTQKRIGKQRLEY